MWRAGLVGFGLVGFGSAPSRLYFDGTVDSITGNAVKILKLVVETGTAFPASPSQGYLFYRTDLNELTFYNGSAWIPVLTGGSGQSGDLTFTVN